MSLLPGEVSDGLYWRSLRGAALIVIGLALMGSTHLREWSEVVPAMVVVALLVPSLVGLHAILVADLKRQLDRYADEIGFRP